MESLKKYRNKYFICYLFKNVSTLVFLITAIIIMWLLDNEYNLLIGVSLIIVAVVLYLIFKGLENKAKFNLKSLIFELALKEMNFKYQKALINSYLNVTPLRTLNIIPELLSKDGSYYYEGSIKGIDFITSSNILIVNKTEKNKKGKDVNYPDTYFNGRIIRYKLDNDINLSVIDKSLKLHYNDLIKETNSFNIYGDEENLKKITNKLTNLEELKKHYNLLMALYFCNGYLYVMIYNKKINIEIDSFKLPKEEDIKLLTKELKLPYLLIDIIK